MPCLIVTEGPDANLVVPLGAGVTVLGREESLKVQLSDPHTSRRHLRIVFDAGQNTHVLEDLKSRHGTRLNGRVVLSQTPLKAGDRISAGDNTLVYLEESFDNSDAALKAVKKIGERDIRTL